MKSYYTVITAILISMQLLLPSCGEKESINVTEKAKNTPATNTSEFKNQIEQGTYERATLAAGCFWGVESSFRKIPGVVATSVGYTGGKTENPTYKEVCYKNTGHAEAVEIVYDPDVIKYEQILKTFFDIHNPTTPNRQGPDIGSQYRSAIFYHNDKQKQTAHKIKAELNKSGKFSRPIVTETTKAQTFYRAEEYHQQYNEKKGNNTCFR
jgi:peptide-methionine (S)-S-oxide reductase